MAGLVLENAPDPDREGKVPLSQSARRALLEKVRRPDRTGGLDRLPDEIRRLKDELRRYKSTRQPLAPDDKAAEVLGPLHEGLEEQVHHVPGVHADEISFGAYPSRLRQSPS